MRPLPLRGGVPTVILLATSVALGACSGLPGADERAVRRRIDSALEEARPTRGRLAHRGYAPHVAPASQTPGIAEAELLLQRIAPDSASRDRLAAYLSVAKGAWADAARPLERALERAPGDAALANDLGVVCLERALEDRAYLLDAFRYFSRAAELDPSLPEARFNLILTYEALRLAEAGRRAEALYRRLDDRSTSPWWIELGEPKSERAGLAFEETLRDGDLTRARSLAAEDPDVFWQVLIRDALRGGPHAALPQPEFLLELAVEVERSNGDPTPRMMVEPLLGPEAGRVRALRSAIVSALGAYQTRGVREVLRSLEEVRRDASSLDSEFDRLWLTLNLAETLAWDGQLAEAEDLLRTVIARARELDLKWVLADALTRYSDQRYADTRATVLGRLEEAIRIYEAAGAASSSMRPRLLLALYAMQEGSSRRAFRLAQEALELSDPDDAVGRRNLIWILSQNAQLDGKLEHAYLTEAAALSRATGAPAGEAEAEIRLAGHFIALGETVRADRHLGRAEEAAAALAAESRAYNDLANTLVESQILQQRDAYDEAAEVLREGLRLLPAGPTAYRSQFHLELADIYAGEGREADARAEFQMGLDALEREDDLLGPRSRLAFDERRREGYEAAIRFEYTRGRAESAWRTVQRYRGKLWTEAFDAEDGHFVPVSASQFPSSDGGALLEFTVLDDRVLIWVVADGELSVRDMAIPRAELEYRVGAMGRLLREAEAIGSLDEVSRDLYEILIGPVENLLGDARWIAIVPDRTLHYLPFAALMDGDGRFLVERFALVSTPEVGYFLRDTPPAGAGSQVVFGSRSGDRGTAAEIDGIAGLYPDAVIFDGPEVTRDTFLGNIAGAGMLVYAGHSAMDGTGSLSSAILLDDAGDGSNTVTALEIAGQSLRANALVVLSSCDSAVGNAIGGVEFRGLTSAFLVAGAGSVVGSLWPVESRETARLMLDFHRGLAGRIPVAAALAAAQRRMIAGGQHPFYWAAFTVTGNQSALASLPAPTE